MALHDRLMVELRNRVPGAIDNQLKDAIWNTLNDFCRDAWVWRETIDITLIVGEVQYTVAVPGADVVHALNVTHATLDTSGALFEYDTLMLATAPLLGDVGTPAFVQAVLTPSLSVGADVEGLIPADMWSTHHQTILDGTLERMYSQPAKPFSNPQLAAYHHRAYSSGKAQARHRAQAGPVPGAQMWKFPPFAKGRRLR
jgi:hypothetical protein